MAEISPSSELVAELRDGENRQAQNHLLAPAQIGLGAAHPQRLRTARSIAADETGFPMPTRACVSFVGNLGPSAMPRITIGTDFNG